MTAQLEAKLSSLARYRIPLLVAAAFLLATQIGPWWYPTQDGCSYLSIARNFAAGQIERLGVPHIYYAPGYPLLISPAFWIDERPFLLLSIVHWALAAAALVAVYRWAVEFAGVPSSAALLLTATALLSAAYWDHLRVTQSEILFVPALLAAALTLNQLCRERRMGATIGYAALGALLVILAGMIRHFGVAVAAGFGLRMAIDAWQRRISWTRAVVLSAAVGLPAAAAVLGLIAFDRHLAEQSQTLTYVDYFRDPGLWRDVGESLAERISESVRLRIADVGRLTVPGMFKAYGESWLDPSMAIYVPLAVFLAIGWWRLVRQTRDVLALTALFYIGLYSVWPFSQATRYIFPMLPLLLACGWYAIEPLRRARLQILAALLVLHLLVAVGYWAKELPEVVAMNRLWGEMELMATRIGTTPVPVAVMGRENGPWLMMQFELDRRADRCREPSEVGGHVIWLVAPREQNAPAGFQLELAGERMNLWRREGGSAPADA